MYTPVLRSASALHTRPKTLFVGEELVCLEPESDYFLLIYYTSPMNPLPASPKPKGRRRSPLDRLFRFVRNDEGRAI